MKIYIYERTCSGSLQHKNHTEDGFKSYYKAHKFLSKKSYNAHATIVSKLQINQAIERYCK